MSYFLQTVNGTSIGKSIKINYIMINARAGEIAVKFFRNSNVETK